jgi:integrase
VDVCPDKWRDLQPGEMIQWVVKQREHHRLAAMHLLQSGVDITVIALWLGHESPSTTHMYVEADLTMKENALKKLQDPSLKSVWYQPDDSILSFLENL